jgi:hypothetical protein
MFHQKMLQPQAASPRDVPSKDAATSSPRDVPQKMLQPQDASPRDVPSKDAATSSRKP